MPPGLFTALVIWAVFLGLLFLGIFGSELKIGARLAKAKTPWERFWLWVVRVLYIISLPILIVMIIFGAHSLWADFKSLFKD